MSVPVIWRVRAILAVLALTLVLSPWRIERLGDNFQIALPVLALGCSVANGEAGEYALRFAAQWLTVQGTKQALGTRPVNRRPNGNYRGMPSGHAAAAFFGASNLTRRCIAGNPAVKAVVWATAVFVGGSRIQARAHDIWQVLIGALIGWLGDRAFRRRGLRAWWRRLRWRG